MKFLKQRRTDVCESKVYFNLLGEIGLEAYSITSLSKKAKKAKSVIFKQVSLLEERGFIERLPIGPKRVGDEKLIIVNRKKINEEVFNYLERKIKLSPILKNKILTNKYVAIDIIGLMQELIYEDYNLNKLIRDYFSNKSFKFTRIKDKDYIEIHKIGYTAISSNIAFEKALHNLPSRVRYRFPDGKY